MAHENLKLPSQKCFVMQNNGEHSSLDITKGGGSSQSAAFQHDDGKLHLSMALNPELPVDMCVFLYK